MGNAPNQRGGSYLYCVTWSQPFSGGSTFQANGIAGQPARVVTQGDLAAIVSDSPTDQYDITLANVRAHEAVIEEAMRRADVLPVSFGTVADSDQSVQRRLLQSQAGELRTQLQHVAGRVEMGVKVLWEQSALFAQIAANDPHIQELGGQIAGTTAEETYDTRVELGELTDQAIQAQRAQDAQAILDTLSPLAVDTRTNNIISDMMIVNAAFLVEKGQQQAFTQKVNQLEQANTGKLIIQQAGPLPPYNFVSVVVHWEEPSGAVAQ
ncbi:MAG TPA: GvpL/GvpF family gas vesicle protein [Ktedonobacterales bacterium]|nr:GvpL/GvpF family gas vesicle protein [Ktedonobacterales bacterium]